MATEYTYGEVLSDVLRKMPRLGRTFTATSIGTTYVANNILFNHTTYAPDIFRGSYQYRYTVATDTPADRVRVGYDIGVPADGKWYHDGPVYTDTTTLGMAMMHADPDRYLAWVMEAQRRQYRLNNRALAVGHDLDCELSGVDYWGGGAVLGNSLAVNCTPTKITSSVWSGTQALQLAMSATNGGVRSETVQVSPGTEVRTGIIARVSSGTGIAFGLWDYSHGAAFGTPVEYSGYAGGEFVYIEQSATVPSGCNLMQLNIYSLSGVCTAIVDTCFGPYNNNMTYELPSSLDEVFKLQYVRSCSFQQSVASHIWTADSRVWEGDFTETGNDYSLEIFRGDVNNRRLQFDKTVQWEVANPQWPLWLAGGPQVSDTEPLSDEQSGTTTQPLDQVSDFVIWVAAEDLSGNDYKDPEWGATLAAYEKKCAIQTLARPRQKKQQSHTRQVVGVWG